MTCEDCRTVAKMYDKQTKELEKLSKKYDSILDDVALLRADAKWDKILK